MHLNNFHFWLSKKYLGFFALAALLILLPPCAQRSEEKKLQVIKSRAEEFLSFLRTGDWEKAAANVLLNDATFQRFNLSNTISPEVMKKEIATLYKVMYSHVKPGAVMSVRIDLKDKNLALVSYRHEDLDGFYMRFVNGNWYYAFE